MYNIKNILEDFMRKLFLICLLLLPYFSSAKELQISLNNDIFCETDRYYSHGTIISYLSEVEPEKHWLLNMNVVAYRISLGQYIYTPVDISIPELIEDDRPYAGLLYLDKTSYFKSGNKIRSFSTLIGAVGDISLSEDSQKIVHKILDATKPMGWDNQLNNEIVVNIGYVERYRIYANNYMDCSTYYGGSLGTLNTQGLIGGVIRAGFGEKLSYYNIINFEPYPKYNSEWYDFNIFIGIEQRFVIHNILLDGNTFSDSHSVDKEYFVNEFMYGISYKYGNWKVIYSNHIRSREFDGQEDNFAFGTLSLIYCW
jgi:lipid A 3-O-deacylase